MRRRDLKRLEKLLWLRAPEALHCEGAIRELLADIEEELVERRGGSIELHRERVVRILKVKVYEAESDIRAKDPPSKKDMDYWNFLHLRRQAYREAMGILARVWGQEPDEMAIDTKKGYGEKTK